MASNTVKFILIKKKNMKITSIKFDNGEIKEIGAIETIEAIKAKHPDESKYMIYYLYQRQFFQFDEQILKYLDYSLIKEYAKDEFDLVEENENEQITIRNFSFEELVEEIERRKGVKQSVVSDAFLIRFEKIITVENPLTIEKILSEIESRLNILK